MAAKLEVLTEDQEALAVAVADEYIADLTLPTEPDMAVIRRWLKVVYGLYDSDIPPQVILSPSPYDALRLASEFTGEKQTFTDYCGIGEGGWVSFYDYFVRIGVLSADEGGDLLAMREYMRVAWDTVLLDEAAIIIRRPTALRLDDNGQLHGAGQPCIEWADGVKDYAWHGLWVPERIVMDPRSYTRDEYLAITDTEQRRALAESGGWAWIAELLGTSELDRWIDPETGLRYALLSAPGGLRFISKQSPPLKDGSQPVYLEPVHEELLTAQAARKWQAVPSLSPAQCERDPSLRYGSET